MAIYDVNLVHTIHWNRGCHAKMKPTSTRKNCARCYNERMTKYGNRCKNHSTLPKGHYYSCMFKKRAGPNRGKFCTRPLHTYHKLFCSTHATRDNERMILRQAIAYRNAAFDQFKRNCGLPTDVTDVIREKLHSVDDIMDSLCQRNFSGVPPPPPTPSRE